MKTYLLLASMLLAAASPVWGQIEDDIYYNPKKEAQKAAASKAARNYIPDFQDIDVDTYNMRGQYYSTPIDTIGIRAENDPDFVYTTQIQKYYNPTIVLDNVDLLVDVLANSYGNVTVEYNINGIPSFGPYVNYLPTAWGNWYLWNSPGWSLSWAWNGPWSGPWWGNPWNWGYGPSWGWGPAWGWGWCPSYPSWGWGPGWGPAWGGGPSWGRPHYADYRPGGNRPVGIRPGWTAGARPGGNYNGRRPMGTARPATRPQHGTARPGSSSAGGPGYTIGNGGHRVSGQGAYQSTSRPGNNTNRVSGTTSRPNRGSGTTVNGNGGHRTSGSGAYQSSGSSTKRQSSTSTQRNSSTQRQSNSSTRRTTNSSTTHRSSGSYSTGGGHRSSGGGGFGGGSRGSSGGGGARGGHR